MNQELTSCSQGCGEDSAVTTRETRPLRQAEPLWNARRHEGGVDLEVQLPGVRKDDVKVEVVGRFLQLEAPRTAADSGQLIYGHAAPDAYRLRLRLADNLNGSRLEAKLENGLLKLSVPLTEAAQPRRIEIL